MVYDPLRAAVTIFGGSPAGGGTLTDTWSWDGTNWTQAAAGAPSIPIRYGMAYDVARQQAVAIAQSSCTSMATWLRGTGSWARPALTGPSARRGAALAAQPTHGQLVLFGGDDGALRDDTWIWDGTAWRGPPVAPSPSARQGHAMATDPLRANVVLFGGGTGSGAAADTWTWDGTGWQAQAPAVSPPPRRGHALAFDGTQVVLFGGSDDEGRTLADTWAWDGASWLLLTPATTPPARAGHAMAFDAHRAQVVLMGGRDGDGDRLADTWTWDGDTWTNVTPVDGPARAPTGP
jgi:hypothetical protein